MALKNSQYYAIMREYEQRQLRNHDIQTARYQEVYKKLPEFKSLDESISILSVQYGKKLLNGDDHALGRPEGRAGDPAQQQKKSSRVRRFPGRLSGTGL